MTKLSTIPDPILSITWGVCKHHSMLDAAVAGGGGFAFK